MPSPNDLVEQWQRSAGFPAGLVRPQAPQPPAVAANGPQLGSILNVPLMLACYHHANGRYPVDTAADFLLTLCAVVDTLDAPPPLAW